MVNWQPTPALLEIIWLASYGKYQKEIAELRKVSLRTIETEWHTIMQKMEADNMTQAVAKALRKGWIE